MYRIFSNVLEIKKKSIFLFQVSVELRLVFLKIGEIDTLKEQFQAEAFIQARWSEPSLKGTVSEM
jgi:hypothetical protein